MSAAVGVLLGVLVGALLGSCGSGPAPPAARPPFPRDLSSAACLPHALWVLPGRAVLVEGEPRVANDDPEAGFDVALFRRALSRARHDDRFESWWELHAKHWRDYVAECEDGRWFELRISPHYHRFTVEREDGCWELDERDRYEWSLEAQRTALVHEGGDLEYWEQQRDRYDSLRAQLEDGLAALREGDPEPLIELLADDFGLTRGGERMARDAAVAWLRGEADSHAVVDASLTPVITSLSSIFGSPLLVGLVLDRRRAQGQGSDVVLRLDSEWQQRDGRFVVVSATASD